ncbi:nitroreductase family protein [Dictyobacter kobayashii]|uniref:Putative oxidoreductase n=1 Tax=Dictyobacter kobayashii TaxID=2014872 RepID=A0A402ALQ0_9CHLR|nr:nitroreductase family protein [Dictyobacter kobayashii]GCE19965.1 putative oxidoreductase [Dictyobacter kobayashii]
MSQLELTPDQLLTTTRTVRKRLDLSRPVEPDIVKECIEIAVQAPSGSNSQQWHFVVVTDAEKRQGLADLYRKSFNQYRVGSNEGIEKLKTFNPEAALIQQRVATSADYLSEHMQEVPVHVVPCIQGRLEGASNQQQAGAWGSILPAVWSFMLAARARGLGTAWTTLHLAYEKEAAELLGIPFEKITQTSLIPVAYTLGTDFKPGPRKSLEKVIHWNNW